jgi:hypothetical protein
MTPDEAKMSSAGDAYVTAARIQGEAAAAYYRAIRSGGVPLPLAWRLTAIWQRAMIGIAKMAS